MLVAIKPVGPSSVYENKDYIMLHIWNKIALKVMPKLLFKINKIQVQKKKKKIKFKDQV